MLYLCLHDPPCRTLSLKIFILSGERYMGKDFTVAWPGVKTNWRHFKCLSIGQQLTNYGTSMLTNTVQLLKENINIRCLWDGFVWKKQTVEQYEQYYPSYIKITPFSFPSFSASLLPLSLWMLRKHSEGYTSTIISAYHLERGGRKMASENFFFFNFCMSILFKFSSQ